MIAKISFMEPNFVPMSEGSLDLLAPANSNDSYQSSLTYFLFTGRKGSWLYKGDCGTAIVSIHPNKDNEVLVFYPTGYSEKVEREINSFVPAQYDIKISRIPSAANDNPLWLEEEETILDWRFPVCILDTNLVADLRGQKFSDVRNNYNRAAKHIDKIEFYNPDVHERELSEYISRWHLSECADSYYKLLELMRTLKNNYGIVAIANEKIVGFIHWDIVGEGQSNMANSLALIVDKTMKGLSEFMMVEMCRAVSSMGCPKINIGGSENLTLHSFKLKFLPELLPLKTYRFKR